MILQIKLTSFGAIVTEIDGHNFDELNKAKKINHKDKPLIILAKTSPYQGMKYLKTRFQNFTMLDLNQKKRE